MFKKTLVAAAAFAFIAGPAFAFHCPADMAKIDAAMTTATLDDAAKAKVTELRAQGEDQEREAGPKEPWMDHRPTRTRAMALGAVPMTRSAKTTDRKSSDRIVVLVAHPAMGSASAAAAGRTSMPMRPAAS